MCALFTTGLISPAEGNAREWECQATFFFVDHDDINTTTTWSMSAGPQDAYFYDRQAGCKSRITSYFYSDGNVFTLRSLPESVQNSICTTGSVNIRVSYNIDRRPQVWGFTQTVRAPACQCPQSCPSGYTMDDTGHRCHRALCGNGNISHPNQNFIDSSNRGVFIWSGILYQMVPATASTSGCRFS